MVVTALSYPYKAYWSLSKNTHSLMVYSSFFWLSVSTKQEKIININQECGQLKKLLNVINWFAI